MKNLKIFTRLIYSSLIAASTLLPLQAEPLLTDMQSKKASKMESVKFEKLDLNTATMKQLTSIKGLGTKKVASILKYREKIGAFTSVDDLLKVKGIGEKLLSKVKPYLTVNG